MTIEGWADERHPAHAADAVVARLLAGYREVLSPDPRRMKAMRAQLVGRVGVNLAPATERPVPLRHARRRPAALLAATLVVGSLAGGVLAVSPGGPLYGLRVWLEGTALTPDAGRRADRDLLQLETRLDDVVAGAAAGNPDAVAAALVAYEQSVGEALASADGDAIRTARLEFILRRHLEHLQALAATLPDSAAGGIGRAIANAVEHGDQMRERIQARSSGPAERTRPAPARGGSDRDGASPKPSAGSSAGNAANNSGASPDPPQKDPPQDDPAKGRP